MHGVNGLMMIDYVKDYFGFSIFFRYNFQLSPGVGEPTSGALVKQVEKRAIREGVAVFAQPQME